MRTSVRRQVAALAVLTTTLLAGCGAGDQSDTAGSGAAETPSARAAPTVEEARAVLDSVPPPAAGDFEGGTFDIGETIPGPTEVTGGRLSSSSWDFYYVLDDGDVGAWGGSVRIFDTAGAAQRSAADLAEFWICGSPRRPVAGIASTPYDVLRATTCARPDGHSYLATVSAAEGPVTANLTVTAPSRRIATAGLTRVWASLSTTTQAVVAGLSAS